MAEIKQGILGGVSGTVGTVVGANWRGKNIIRSKPRKTKKAASDKQIEQRKKFKIVANFLSPLFALTSKYFGQYQGVKSRTNLAMSYHLLECIEPDGDDFKINFPKVVLTKGVLQPVIIESVRKIGDNVTVEWKDNVSNNLSKANDKVSIVIYNPQDKFFINEFAFAERSEQTLSVTIPENWKGTDNQVWIVLTSDTQCSSSIYAGTF